MSINIILVLLWNLFHDLGYLGLTKRNFNCNVKVMGFVLPCYHEYSTNMYLWHIYHCLSLLAFAQVTMNLNSLLERLIIYSLILFCYLCKMGGYINMRKKKAMFYTFIWLLISFSFFHIHIFKVISMGLLNLQLSLVHSNLIQWTRCFLITILTWNPKEKEQHLSAKCRKWTLPFLKKKRKKKK